MSSPNPNTVRTAPDEAVISNLSDPNARSAHDDYYDHEDDLVDYELEDEDVNNNNHHKENNNDNNNDNNRINNNNNSNNSNNNNNDNSDNNSGNDNQNNDNGNNSNNNNNDNSDNNSDNKTDNENNNNCVKENNNNNNSVTDKDLPADDNHVDEYDDNNNTDNNNPRSDQPAPLPVDVTEELNRQTQNYTEFLSQHDTVYAKSISSPYNNRDNIHRSDDMARTRKQKQTKTTCTEETFFREVLGDEYETPTDERIHGAMGVLLYVMGTHGAALHVGGGTVFPDDDGRPRREMHGHPLPSTTDSDLIEVRNVRIFQNHQNLQYPYTFTPQNEVPKTLEDIAASGFYPWDARALVPVPGSPAGTAKGGAKNPEGGRGGRVRGRGRGRGGGRGGG